MGVIIIFIQKAIAQGIGILFGALGEILTEKSGNLNLGIPGIMYMGGIAGLIGAFLYEKSCVRRMFAPARRSRRGSAGKFTPPRRTHLAAASPAGSPARQSGGRTPPAGPRRRGQKQRSGAAREAGGDVRRGFSAL